MYIDYRLPDILSFLLSILASRKKNIPAIVNKSKLLGSTIWIFLLLASTMSPVIVMAQVPDANALVAAGQDPATIDCSPDPTTKCESIRRVLMVSRALEQASQEFNIPLPILQAVAYHSGRWSFAGCDPSTYVVKPVDRSNIPEGLGAHTGGHQYPPMGLSDDVLEAESLFLAAKLLKLRPEELACDYRQNIRGGAALLAQIEKDQESKKGMRLGPNLENWKHALMDFSGFSGAENRELYAARIYRVLLEGANKFGVSMQPQPELAQFIESSFSENIQVSVGLKKKLSLR